MIQEDFISLHTDVLPIVNDLITVYIFLVIPDPFQILFTVFTQELQIFVLMKINHFPPWKD